MKRLRHLCLALLFLASCAPATGVPQTQKPEQTASLTSNPGPGPSPNPGTTQTPTQASPTPPKLEPFGSVTIEPDEIAFNASGSGRNVDSIAFWEAPDPAGSLMIVTSKGNESVEVYRYPFREQLAALVCGQASNGVWVDQEQDRLYLTERNSNQVCVHRLPGLEPENPPGFQTPATGGESEPNLTLLHLPGGQSSLYVSYDDIVYYHDAENGKALGKFRPVKGLETMYADDFYQALYIPDENDRSGVYVYDPDGEPAGAKFGDRSIFQADAEGIWVYQCLTMDGSDGGEGLIVVSDQVEELTDLEVFNRKTKEYLGKINISGVNNTDGIAISQQAYPEYPLGLLAVIDDDTSTVGVGWDLIFAKTGLSCGV